MFLKLKVLLLVTGFIGALGQIVQIPNTPTKVIGGFSWAEMVIVDEGEGRVYVSDRGHHNVRVFNENGDLINTITAGFNQPGGMAISTTGVLYTADLFNHRIVMTTKDGFFLGTIGSYGSGNGQLNDPHGVTIGPDGLLYVADYGNRRIQVLTLNGQFVKKINLPSSGVSIAFGTDGRLHATLYSLHKILVFDANGNQVQSVNVGYYPLHIHIDSDGYIYVACQSYGNGAGFVSIYDEYYHLLRTISGFTTSSVRGVARWEGKNEVWAVDGVGGKLYAFTGP